MAISAHVKPARELVNGDWININGVARKLKMICPSPFAADAMVGLAIGDGARLYPVSLSADSEIEYVSNEEMEAVERQREQNAHDRERIKNFRDSLEEMEASNED